MKIKIFIACEIQYFELGIFSFNSYVYYLPRSFITSTRAFNLLTCAFNLQTPPFSLPTRAFNLAIRAFSILTRGFELTTPNSLLVFYFSTSKNVVQSTSEAYSGLCQTTKMELFMKTVKFIFTKSSNLDVCQASEYTFVLNQNVSRIIFTFIFCIR